MSECAVVEILGVRVHRVDGLDKQVIYCPAYDAAFVRTDLDDEARRIAADWLLSEVLDKLAEATR